MKNRIQLFRNNGSGTERRTFGHEVIRHHGSVQHLVWFGPTFAIVRNRKCAAIVTAVRDNAAVSA